MPYRRALSIIILFIVLSVALFSAQAQTSTPVPTATPHDLLIEYQQRELEIQPVGVNCETSTFLSRLIVGEQAKVTNGGVNLHTQPDDESPSYSRTHATAILDVFEGPVCDDEGRVWWHVRYRSNIQGWTIEGINSQFFLEPIVGSALFITPYATIATMTPISTIASAREFADCEDALPSRIKAGEQARNISGSVLSIRDEPRDDGRHISLVHGSAVVDVVEGPRCDDAERVWWFVRYTSNFAGWMVEGDRSRFFIEPIAGSYLTITPFKTQVPTATRTQSSPTMTHTQMPPTITRTMVPTLSGTQVVVTCPGFMPSRLTIGGQGVVLPGPANNVRENPATGAELIGQIVAGGQFTVINGPVCDAAGRAWWQVNHNGLIGWTVEGQGDEYFVEPLAP